MKTKTILSMVVMAAFVFSAFAPLAMAGESDTIVGNTLTAADADGAAVVAWIPARPLQIVSDLVGVTGMSGASTTWMYDAGNFATPWVNGDTVRTMVCWDNPSAGYGYAISGDLTLVSGSGFQPSSTPNIVPMVQPTGAWDGDSVPLTWADPGDANIAGYLVYRSATGAFEGEETLLAASGATVTTTNQWWSNPCDYETATSWTAGLAFDDTTAAAGNTYYYALRYVYAADGVNNIPTQEHTVWGAGNPDGTFAPVFGQSSAAIITGAPANTNAVVSDSQVSVAGNLLAGDHTDETVTITVEISDAANEGDLITGAEINVNGEGWVAMTNVNALDTDTEQFYYDYTAPAGYYPEGAISYDVRGDDGQGGPLTPATDSFTITDTTNPTASFTSAPGATAYIGGPIPFIASYEDFTALDFTVANSYFEYTVNNGSANQVAWTNNSFAWNSYSNFISYNLATGGFVATDNIDYQGVVTDSSGNSVTFGAGTVIMTDAPPGVQDPYPVYGYVYLYDGTSGGGYAPITSTGGATVTVSWINTTTAAASSIVTATNAAGQYSVDLLNYTDGGVVEVSATFEAPYGNNGYNSTTITVGSGGSMQEVVCGVPYEVVITVPVPAATVTAGVPFSSTYQILDRDGALAQGYFTFADGPMEWYSGDALFVPPALTTFDGTTSATPATFTGPLTLFTSGNQWINITEGGPAELNNFPTPWGGFTVSIGFTTVNGYLDDYDNITVNVIGGGFTWELLQGWNLVSAPQDAGALYGTDGVFDADDAMNHCFDYTQDPNMAMAMRTGPSTYTVNDEGIGEAGAFDLDSTAGYWVFLSQAPVVGVVPFNATNWTSLGTMSVAAGAGWNLLGFTHNYTGGAGWTVTPTASMFTDGTVDADLTVGGAAGAKIIVTDWNQGSQWYHSYVASTTFPGMPAHDWVWDTAYASDPGNAYFLWVEAGVTVDFNVNF